MRFKSNNGKAIEGMEPKARDIPRLIPYRNGRLTAQVERILIAEVAGIVVPPGGVTVTVDVETQHDDPDLAAGPGVRIFVWREARHASRSAVQVVASCKPLAGAQQAARAADSLSSPSAARRCADALASDRTRWVPVRMAPTNSR
jgi:hypothetical protein